MTDEAAMRVRWYRMGFAVTGDTLRERLRANRFSTKTMEGFQAIAHVAPRINAHYYRVVESPDTREVPGIEKLPKRTQIDHVAFSFILDRSLVEITAPPASASISSFSKFLGSKVPGFSLQAATMDVIEWHQCLEEADRRLSVFALSTKTFPLRSGIEARMELRGDAGILAAIEKYTRKPRTYVDSISVRSQSGDDAYEVTLHASGWAAIKGNDPVKIAGKLMRSVSAKHQAASAE